MLTQWALAVVASPVGAAETAEMGGAIMPQPSLKRLVYAGAITLPVGIVLFIGAIVAIVAKLVALGGVLMALAIVSVGTGCVLMLLVRNRARAVADDMQAKNQAAMDAVFRDHPELRDYPEGGRLP